MKILTLILLAAVTISAPLYAHPDHEPDMGSDNTKTVPELAQDEVIRLVSKAALDTSWAGIAPAKTESMKAQNGMQQWVVTFENAEIKDPAKKMLYIVMSDTGVFVSSGHTKP